jgi:hypothetical protein
MDEFLKDTPPKRNRWPDRDPTSLMFLEKLNLYFKNLHRENSRTTWLQRRTQPNIKEEVTPGTHRVSENWKGGGAFQTSMWNQIINAQINIPHEHQGKNSNYKLSKLNKHYNKDNTLWPRVLSPGNAVCLTFENQSIGRYGGLHL